MKARTLVAPLGVVVAVGLAAISALVLTSARSSARAWPDTGQGPQPDRRAAIFMRRGCSECHAISGLGVVAARDVGPDLTFAYADVVTRYGVNLESFLYNPTGVMRLVLAAHLHLSWADRKVMVAVLKGLYLERRAEMDQRIPSFPPGRFRLPERADSLGPSEHGSSVER